MELGNAAGPDALIAAAHPVLERTCAQTGETASLAVPGMDGLTYVDEVTPAAVVTASWLGRSVPLHATSTGKALLAFLPPEQVQRVLSGPLTSFTATTITDPQALAAELAATRARGYGVCAGELESSLYGVSAPVLDRAGRPLAVLSIWGPRDRVHEGLFAQVERWPCRPQRSCARRGSPRAPGQEPPAPKWPDTPAPPRHFRASGVLQVPVAPERVRSKVSMYGTAAAVRVGWGRRRQQPAARRCRDSRRRPRGCRAGQDGAGRRVS